MNSCMQPCIKIHPCPEQLPEICLENSAMKNSAKHYVTHYKTYVTIDTDHGRCHNLTTQQVISPFMATNLNGV